MPTTLPEIVSLFNIPQQGLLLSRWGGAQFLTCITTERESGADMYSKEEREKEWAPEE